MRALGCRGQCRSPLSLRGIPIGARGTPAVGAALAAAVASARDGAVLASAGDGAGLASAGAGAAPAAGTAPGPTGAGAARAHAGAARRSQGSAMRSLFLAVLRVGEKEEKRIRTQQGG